MRIHWMNVVIGAGAGGLDEVMEDQDANNARTEPFKTWTDWSRVGLCAVGFLGQAFNFFPAIAAPLAQSETPLVTKSIIKAVRNQAASTSSYVTRASRGKETPTNNVSGKRVGWRPLAVGG